MLFKRSELTMEVPRLPKLDSLALSVRDVLFVVVDRLLLIFLVDLLEKQLRSYLVFVRVSHHNSSALLESQVSAIEFIRHHWWAPLTLACSCCSTNLFFLLLNLSLWST